MNIDGKPRAAVGAAPVHWPEAVDTEALPIASDEVVRPTAEETRLQEIEDRVRAERKIEQENDMYRICHENYNHSDANVDAAILQGVFTGVKPVRPPLFH
jgi:hypothetical protein